jgi:MoaA/NifB/PqqE/SkfB family radical SAM enzyme
MALEMFRRVCAAVPTPLKTFKLYGLGEPFLHPQFTTMVYWAQQVTERVEITTNGTVPMVLPELLVPTFLRVSVYDAADPRPAHNLRALVRQPLLRVVATAQRPITGKVADLVDECVVEELHSWNCYGATCGQPTVTRACATPFYSLHITSDGTCVACCNDWNRGTTVGNVRDSTVVEVWNGVPLARLRLQHVQGCQREIPSCANCRRQPPDRVVGRP